MHKPHLSKYHILRLLRSWAMEAAVETDYEVLNDGMLVQLVKSKSVSKSRCALLMWKTSKIIGFYSREGVYQ